MCELQELESHNPTHFRNQGDPKYIKRQILCRNTKGGKRIIKEENKNVTSQISTVIHSKYNREKKEKNA
jgi:hypothetical protein